MKKKYERYLNKHSSTLEGKLCVVTGATGGLGEALCEYLLYLKADVILACRNTSKADALKSRLEELDESYKGKIFVEKLDVSSRVSIDEFINNLSNYRPVDILFNNAGILDIKNDDKDIEITIRTNVVGPLYLTKKILDILGTNAKIITTTSLASTMFKGYTFDKTKFEDFTGMRIYAISKKMLSQSFTKLRLENPDFKFELVHPGTTSTSLFTKTDKKFTKAFYPLTKVFHSKEKAAFCLLAGVFKHTKVNQWIGPRGLLSMSGYPSIKRLPRKIIKKSNYESSYNLTCSLIEKFK